MTRTRRAVVVESMEKKEVNKYEAIAYLGRVVGRSNRLTPTN